MINGAKATEILHSRGPDFQRTINNDFVSFGHRRLSILDPTPAGNQPFEDDNHWLTFNGEIYNYKDLRSELESRGETFHSQSDTEVLFRLLKIEGEKALNKINGDFALAFYDRQEDSVLLARDRFGVKPLYYYLDEDKFIFASEIKSILAYGLALELDFESLLMYLQLNYIPAPATIYRNVFKLQPGRFLKVSRNEFEESTFYTLKPFLEVTDYNEASDMLAGILEESVKSQLVSDVPLGSFLSGGLDSTIIAMLAKRHQSDLHTFSIGFKGNKFYDETSYALMASKHIGSEHTVFELSEKEILEHIFSSLEYFDEPFADSSAIAVNLLSRETRKHSTVALSGDGSDELFGGYNKHTAWVKSIAGKGSWMASLSPALNFLPGSRSGFLGNKVRQARKFGAGIKLEPKERYWLWATLAGEKESRTLLSGAVVDSLSMESYLKRKGEILNYINTGSLGEHLLSDLHLVLPDDMLTKVDRMSMANGLEVRVPFLDTKVVEFAFGLPDQFKNDGVNGKIILKEAFKNQLPEKILNRSKKGFDVPVLKWLRKDLKKMVRDELLSVDFLQNQGIFNVKEVRQLLKKVNSANPGDSHARVWALVCFQTWWRKYNS